MRHASSSHSHKIAGSVSDTSWLGVAADRPQSDIVVPPVLYLPVREHPEGGLLAEVHETTDGRFALLVFTALDRLIDACGDKQPWKLVETPSIDAIHDTQPYDIVAFDPELPKEFLAEGRIL